MDGNSSDLEQLEEEEEKEEENDEEWIPQAMHDDGSSDSSDEEDYQFESVVQSSIEVEIPTTVKKQSVKDNAKNKEYNGDKNNFNLHLSISLHLMRKGQKTGVTGLHTCISNSLSLMKCYRKRQNKQICTAYKKRASQ